MSKDESSKVGLIKKKERKKKKRRAKTIEQFVTGLKCTL